MKGKRSLLRILLGLALALGFSSVKTVPAKAADGPTVTGISPSSGPLAGGTFVTITGTGFVDGAVPTIGDSNEPLPRGNTLSGVYWVSPTKLIGTTRPATAGAKDVVVTNPDGQTGRLTGGYTFDPALTGPTVITGAPTGLTTTGATLNGNLTVKGDSSTVIVYFEYGLAGIYWTNRSDGVPSTMEATGAFSADVTGLSPYTLYHFRAWAVGGGNAGRSGDQTFTTLALFAPEVAGVEPASGPAAGGTDVTITGTGFLNGANVTIAGAPATGVTWVSSSLMKATTPAGAGGFGDVVVTNPDTQAGSLVGGFYFDPAPTVARIAVASGPTAGGTPVTITGSGFRRGARVTIGDVAAANITWMSSTLMTATTPAGAVGARDVMVTNPDAQTGMLPGGFTYVAAPTVTSIAPIIGPLAGGTGVTINGTGFASGATVTIGGAAAAAVTWLNSTSITATTPPGPAGAGDVVVTNPDTQTGSLPGGFMFTAAPAPTVLRLSPASGPAAGGTAVRIKGTGFATGANVTIGGTAATAVTRVSATLIRASTPNGSAGAKDVVVTNPDTQSGALTGGFTATPAMAASGGSTAQTPAPMPTSVLIATITATVIVVGFFLVRRGT